MEMLDVVDDRQDDPVLEISGWVVRESRTGLQFFDGYCETWLRKREIRIISRSGGRVTLEMASWLAWEKGYV